MYDTLLRLSDSIKNLILHHKRNTTPTDIPSNLDTILSSLPIDVPTTSRSPYPIPPPRLKY